MTTEERIQKIADEAIEKIKAIRAEAGSDEWPKVGDNYLFLNGCGIIEVDEFEDDIWYKGRQARCRIAPHTEEGRARLERLSEWEVFFADYMTAGDAEINKEAYHLELNYDLDGIYGFRGKSSLGQRGFTTEAKRDEWLNKWGRDYVEKMLKGGMP